MKNKKQTTMETYIRPRTYGFDTKWYETFGIRSKSLVKEQDL